MPTETSPPARDRWCDIDGHQVALLSWVEQVAEDPAALFSGLHQRGDVHVLELAGAGNPDRGCGPLLDAAARAAYRRRLAELDEDLATAATDHDLGRTQQVEGQRAALIAELGRATGLAGRSRTLGASTTERARKAVSARLRGAIQRIEAVLPALGAHLDRSVITGTTCRYEPTEPLSWTLSSSHRHAG